MATCQKSLIDRAANRLALAIERLINESGVSRPPLDLYPLATRARIHTLKYRRMLSDGLVRPDTQGFTVFLNAKNEGDFDIAAGSRPQLSLRQRFTFAHELAHTLFFDCSVTPPREAVPADCEPILEQLCQLGAGLFLIPEHLLRIELGRSRRIDSLQQICDVANVFQTSLEVLLRRVDSLEEFKATDKMLLLCGRENPKQDVIVKACVYSSTLVNVATRPQLFSPFKAWCGQNLTSKVAHGNSGDTVVPRCGGSLLVEKRPINLAGDFLVGISFEA